MEELCESSEGEESILPCEDGRKAFSRWLVLLTSCVVSFLIGMTTMYFILPSTNKKPSEKSRIDKLKDCEDLICSFSNYIEAQCHSLCGP
ncbi:hypothetical protein GUITHDRAFT_152065 [Guillardia theta CCMP2712]|uniref:Uncharacterized protein n=1 Tax=Guillardia theta (strain CCMP2712) TaxID=905079 RepID=L1JFH8_GUITC|nr:hypothetical protein GUITHDRAFT_152065 [Guillardia theta CCMP2712]EKX47256.1 hypothetical protein GUITHDRAFT_152065 [Guillardia theta CCMP2712]|eukprot:XP_005834236.1 hypothetical protein GUITHDRAFT_152065 [Guillardia theta CCMP2712]